MSELGFFDILIEDSGREQSLSGSVSPASSSSTSCGYSAEPSSCDFVSETRDLALTSNPDLLTASLAESGLLLEDDHQPIWEKDTDDLLQSILTGSSEVTANDLGGGGFDGPFSDTSSDSGVNLEQQLLSPSSSMALNGMDDHHMGSVSPKGDVSNDVNGINNLIDYISNDTEDELPLQSVNPVTNSPEPTLIPVSLANNAPKVTSVTPIISKASKPATVNSKNNPIRIVTTGGRPIRPIQTIQKVTNLTAPQIKAISSIQTGTTTILLPMINTNNRQTIKTGNGLQTVITSTGNALPTFSPSHSASTGTPLVVNTVSTPSSLQVTPSNNPTKRRRLSASSSDSGLDDHAHTTPTFAAKQGKYPPLVLNEEERRLCEREGIKLPSHYPLSREEEKNLKRIRRKIRNKVSAQDSRKRKKEYVDAMEDRVKACSEENDELKKKLEQMESQNKTLAGQLRRLHQIIVNGGVKQTQKSTAMMVLLLSTALFLIPGFKESSETKCDLDIMQAVKMPPLPGQSRSLLQFTPSSNIKQEFPANTNVNANTCANSDDAFVKAEPAAPQNNENEKKHKAAANAAAAAANFDHDYFVAAGTGAAGAGAEANGKSAGHSPFTKSAKSILMEQASKPSKVGYAMEMDVKGAMMGVVGALEEVKTEPMEVDGGLFGEEVIEKRINVSRSGQPGMRTVVLHVPKDME